MTFEAEELSIVLVLPHITCGLAVGTTDWGEDGIAVGSVGGRVGSSVAGAEVHGTIARVATNPALRTVESELKTMLMQWVSRSSSYSAAEVTVAVGATQPLNCLSIHPDPIPSYTRTKS